MSGNLRGSRRKRGLAESGSWAGESPPLSSAAWLLASQELGSGLGMLAKVGTGWHRLPVSWASGCTADLIVGSLWSQLWVMETSAGPGYGLGCCCSADLSSDMAVQL
jgi:hypothetical protein